MNTHVEVSGLSEEARVLAERYPVLHQKFGEAVLAELVSKQDKRSLRKLEASMKSKSYFVEGFIRGLLGREVERLDRKANT